jgi:NAD(P)-dependent dehydrogenase (short-subunit alcohol dehydrogenase family)
MDFLRRQIGREPNGAVPRMSLAFMSSRMGSGAENDSGGIELYRASKAALNSLTRSFVATDIRDRPVAVLTMHPGWVRTDTGGPRSGARPSRERTAHAPDMLILPPEANVLDRIEPIIDCGALRIKAAPLEVAIGLGRIEIINQLARNPTRRDGRRRNAQSTDQCNAPELHQPGEFHPEASC